MRASLPAFAVATLQVYNFILTNAAQNFPSVSGAKSLVDDYEYVMHGKVFKYKDKESQGQVKIQVGVTDSHDAPVGCGDFIGAQMQTSS